MAGPAGYPLGVSISADANFSLAVDEAEPLLPFMTAEYPDLNAPRREPYSNLACTTRFCLPKPSGRAEPGTSHQCKATQSSTEPATSRNYYEPRPSTSEPANSRPCEPKPDSSNKPDTSSRSENKPTVRFGRGPSRGCKAGYSIQYEPGLSMLCEPGPSSQSEPGPSSRFEPGPSSPCEFGPSSQCELGPSSRCEPGPSRQCELGPSSRCEPGPSRQCEFGPYSQCNFGQFSQSDLGSFSQCEPGPSSQCEPGPSSQCEPGPSSQCEPGPSSQCEPGPSSQCEPGPSSRCEPGPSSRYEPGPSSRYEPRPSSRCESGASSRCQIGPSHRCEPVPSKEERKSCLSKKCKPRPWSPADGEACCNEGPARSKTVYTQLPEHTKSKNGKSQPTKAHANGICRLLENVIPGTLPECVTKHVYRAGKWAAPQPPYDNGTRLKFQFKTLAAWNDQLFDDSLYLKSPMEIIVGKKFKVEVWEIGLNTMRKGEVSQFRVPKEHCLMYPLVSKVLRESRLQDKVPVKTQSCCGHMVNGTGHPDLDELMNNPKDLTFVFELLEVNLPGSYEMEAWYMEDREKLESIPRLREEGNYLYKKERFKEAGEKYYEGILRLDQLISKEAPDTRELEELEMKKVPLLTNFAQCLIKQREFYEAIKFLNKAIKLDPENVKAYYRRAQALKGTKSWENARNDFFRALALDSSLHKAVTEQITAINREARLFVTVERTRYKKMFVITRDGPAPDVK